MEETAKYAIIEADGSIDPIMLVYTNPANVYRYAIKIIQDTYGDVPAPLEAGMPPFPALDMSDDESVTEWYEHWHAYSCEIWVTLDVDPVHV